MRKFLVIVICLLHLPLCSENLKVEMVFLDSAQRIIATDCISFTDFKRHSILDKKPNPVFQLFRKKQRLNKKITAAVLAFPLPFGIVGLHRIYLGTKPYVPVTYIASVGGAFGILPFIDFCAISFGKNFDQYRDNGKVFMWIKD